MKGVLYVVATPIGNLGDISPRAKMVLENVDLIVAEDTRHSGLMLKQFGIKTKLRSYHDHNERNQYAVIIEQLELGLSVALIADAGTPLIADPGYHLLLAAHSEKIKVIPIPGPSALTSALSVAGFSANKFIFEGYLPAKAIDRRRRLELLRNESRTLILYEVPHRILASIEDIIAYFGTQRQVVIAKEMTKIHENIQRGILADILVWLHSEKTLAKGEFVVVVQGNKVRNKVDQFDTEEASRILKILLVDHSIKDATKLTHEIIQGNRNQIYKLALALAKR